VSRPERFAGSGTHPDHSGADVARQFEGTHLAGRYDLGRALGQGGMGVVLLARDRVLSEDVAIKLLRTELAGDRRWRERLAREVKLARQLRHPNVCRLFDFGQTEDGQVFVVMELASHTLRSELDGAVNVQRSFADRIADVCAVAAGLAAIHQAGIIHADLSSRNVLRCVDGRLIVADFGLAVEADVTAASLQGGTAAYMAPEVGLGHRASFGSDVWSLGILIHEIMFGMRPSWAASGVAKGIELPGRKMGAQERAIWRLCRACTDQDPTRRPTDAAVVLTRLQGGRGAVFPHLKGSWSGLKAMLILGMISLAGVEALRVPDWLARHKARPRTNASVIVPSDDTIRDWTQSSRLLAEVPGQIWCLLALPGGRSLRFVWGTPRHAEDIDIATGHRRPSPLVPASYSESCPDLSPDGRQLIFEGHDPSGAPAIFRSPHSDGSQATPVVKSAEPDIASAPKWFADGAAFAFSIDNSHVGVIETGSDRLVVAGADFPDGFEPYGWIVGGDRVYMLGSSTSGESHVETLAWPAMNISQHWTVKLVPSECYTTESTSIFCTDSRHTLVVIHPEQGKASAAGAIAGQTIGPLLLTQGGIGFVTFDRRGDAWLEASGQPRRLTFDGRAIDIARCGGGVFLLNEGTTSGKSVLVRRAASGELTPLTSESSFGSPLCAEGGKQWWFGRTDATEGGYFHCVESRCDRISADPIHGPALSPDGTRIAYLAAAKRGLRIRVMSTTGGDVHDLADSETLCAPGWSSDHTLWVSRHRRGKYIWTEVDDRSGAETGRSKPGSSKDCHDGEKDPASPVDPELRIIVEHKSQVRWQRFPDDATVSPVGAGADGVH